MCLRMNTESKAVLSSIDRKLRAGGGWGTRSDSLRDLSLAIKYSFQFQHALCRSCLLPVPHRWLLIKHNIGYNNEYVSLHRFKYDYLLRRAVRVREDAFLSWEGNHRLLLTRLPFCCSPVNSWPGETKNKQQKHGNHSVTLITVSQPLTGSSVIIISAIQPAENRRWNRSSFKKSIGGLPTRDSVLVLSSSPLPLPPPPLMLLLVMMVKRNRLVD